MQIFNLPFNNTAILIFYALGNLPPNGSNREEVSGVTSVKQIPKAQWLVVTLIKICDVLKGKEYFPIMPLGPGEIFVNMYISIEFLLFLNFYLEY